MDNDILILTRLINDMTRLNVRKVLTFTIISNTLIIAIFTFILMVLKKGV